MHYFFKICEQLTIHTFSQIIASTLLRSQLSHNSSGYFDCGVRIQTLKLAVASGIKLLQDR